MKGPIPIFDQPPPKIGGSRVVMYLPVGGDDPRGLSTFGDSLRGNGWEKEVEIRCPVADFDPESPEDESVGLVLVVGNALDSWGYHPPSMLRGVWGGLRGVPAAFLPPWRWEAPELERRAWEEEFRDAVDRERYDPPNFTDYMVAENVGDLEHIAEKVEGANIAVDYETSGVLSTSDFQILTMSIACVDLLVGPYLIPERLLALPVAKQVIRDRILRKTHVWAHNAKFESRASLDWFGYDLRFNLAGDTMLSHKHLKADGPAGLASLAWKVGMGGHKDEVESLLGVAKVVLMALRRAAAKEVPLVHGTEERVLANGKKQRRKVVLESRPPDTEEQAAAVHAAMFKVRNRNIGGTSHQTSYAAQLLGWDGEGIPPEPLDIFEDPRAAEIPMDRWVHASTVGAGEDVRAYTYGLILREPQERYCVRDTVATAALVRRAMLHDGGEPALREALPDVPFHTVPHLRLLPWALARIEAWGMTMNTDTLRENAKMFADKMKDLREKLASQGIDDPGSNDKVAEFLFKREGLTPIRFSKKTKKPSVDAATLRHLEGSHPAVDLLLSYRAVTKIQGTYAEGLLRAVMDDGRIRASLLPHGAETGRLSCRNPNLQTIPGRTEEGRHIKRAFAAPPGKVLIQLDYSALEVRVAAILSGDPVLTEIFERGGDPHRETAILLSPMLFGSPFEDEDPSEQSRRRKIIKGVVFGTLYGQGADALATLTGLPKDDAVRAQKLTMGRYAVLRSWIDQTVADARHTGVCRTWWGGKPLRVRPVPAILSRNDEDQGHAERQSYNTPIQGSGSEYCIASAVALVAYIMDSGIDAKLTMTVHDSLIGEVAEEDAEEFVQRARSIMLGWDSGKVPLAVDVEAGPTWGSLISWDDFIAARKGKTCPTPRT